MHYNTVVSQLSPKGAIHSTTKIYSEDRSYKRHISITMTLLAF